MCGCNGSTWKAPTVAEIQAADAMRSATKDALAAAAQPRGPRAPDYTWNGPQPVK